MVTNEEFYLKLDVKPYAGKWIALAKGSLVASGASAKTVLSEAEKVAPRSQILLNWVPTHDTLIF